MNQEQPLEIANFYDWIKKTLKKYQLTEENGLNNPLVSQYFFDMLLEYSLHWCTIKTIARLFVQCIF